MSAKGRKMAKFVITLSDKDGGVNMVAKNYGNERMNPPTLAQDTGATMVAFYHSIFAPKKPWWKRIFGIC